MAFELLIIAAPRILEDPLLETLLEHPATEFFGSVPFRGHGARPEHLSVHEQVAGWRREVRVEVLVRKDDRPALLDALRDRFATEAVRWWALPVSAQGSLASPGERSTELDGKGAGG